MRSTKFTWIYDTQDPVTTWLCFTVLQVPFYLENYGN